MALVDPTNPEPLDILNGYVSKNQKNSIEYKYGFGTVLNPSVGQPNPRTIADLTVGELGPFQAGSIENPGSNAKWIKDGIVQKPTTRELTKATADLIPFRFELINNDRPAEADFLVFRALLSGFTDGYSASWNPINYNGRGESLYVYQQTVRQISFNFRVAAETREGLRAMQIKLNALASSTFGDYDQTRMRGSLQRITIGDWLTAQPGFITNLTLTPFEEAAWETDRTRGYIIPKVVDVSVSFTPIHDFLPRKSLYRSKLILPSWDEKKQGLGWLRPLRSMESGIKPITDVTVTPQTGVAFNSGASVQQSNNYRSFLSNLV